jgi:hypothetical protein
VIEIETHEVKDLADTFLPETKQLINPNLIALQIAINKSTASKFIKDPAKFLEKNYASR